MKFSDRIGATTPRESLQIEAMDEGLSNKLWNTLLENYLYINAHKSRFYHRRYLNIWTRFLRKPGDEISSSDSECRRQIKDWFFKAKWYNKYNLIEYISDCFSHGSDDFKKEVNSVLAQEKAGYRFIDSVLVPISDENEIKAIETSSTLPDKYSGARQHIKNATEAFSQNPSPDYAQVITESISGVESIAKVITGNKKATLGEALNELDKKKPMHGAMKEAFKKLYGYTSDEEGLRHSMLTDETKVSEADAHFMLVVCSAFINFAVAHYQTD